MTIHVFHRSGHEPRTVLVRAGSEVEARGKAQKELPSGSVPQYKGELDDLMSSSDVLDTGVRM